SMSMTVVSFFFQAEDGIRDATVTGVQTCALPIYLGEPLADNSVMPTYYVSKFARTGVTVALTGDGGDEVFAGYRRFYQIRRMEWLARRGLIPLWRGVRRLAVSVANRTHPGRTPRRFPATRADAMLGMAGH